MALPRGATIIGGPPLSIVVYSFLLGMDYHRHPPAASSALVELTTRLDFFKERRSQLMEQLHNLDINYAPTPQDFVYKPSSPPWH